MKRALTGRKLFKKWRYGWLSLVICFVVMFGQCARQYAYGYAYGFDGTLSLGAHSIAATMPEANVPERNDSSVNDSLDRGKVLYDAGQYAAAIATWKQALPLAQNDLHQQAIVHNYLAIAHQSLSEWDNADAQIQQGLDLLGADQRSAFLKAQLLNTQGSNQLQTGQAAAALETWQMAIDLYRSLNSNDAALALARTHLNQAQALRVLGFYNRAKTTLETVRTDIEPSLPPAMKLTVLQSLGQLLFRTGDLEQAQAVLSEALTFADNSFQQAAVQLNLAQITAALGDPKAALNLYQQARDQGTPTTQLEATLNQLDLRLDNSEDPSFSWSAINQDLEPLFRQISALPPSRWGINAQIYLANLLIDTVKLQRLANLDISAQAIGQQLAHALQQARSLQDKQAEASALGQLGHLYEQTQQWASAFDLTEQALKLIPSADTSYANAQWQWQLGRILKAQGLLEESRDTYGTAVSQLDTLQYDIVALNPEAKFSFRDRIEPVYRGYVELLLADIEQQPIAIRQQRLQQARDTMEALQLAELQNYFRETCLTYQTREIESIDPHAAIVYPIFVSDRLEVIVSLPHQPLQHHSIDLTNIDQDALLQTVLSSLHPVSPVNAVIPLGQQLYNWLIAPIAPQLEQQSIETLVFVPDGFLRNIPMAILHDGSGYLLERYNLALTPSMQLLNSRPLKPGTLTGLTAGLTTARQGFSALPGVAQEINKIEQLVSTKILINEHFTKRNILDSFKENEFSIVHLATHGQFSASSEDTFLLTWDDRINVKDLGELFQTAQGRDAPIELLVLSACQTAQGDQRATLGLAGVAIESGARSTVATLWRVQDSSTATLMSEFYRRLADTQQPRAKALRESQLMLMRDPNYQHPYHWAPFVMIGNWQ